jgi:hypothetical protein
MMRPLVFILVFALALPAGGEDASDAAHKVLPLLPDPVHTKKSTKDQFRNHLAPRQPPTIEDSKAAPAFFEERFPGVKIRNLTLEAPRTGRSRCGPRASAGATVSSAEVIACEARYTENKCEEFKAALDDYDKPAVMDCKNPEAGTLNPVTFAVSCGGGLVNFVWHSIQGIMNLPQALEQWNDQQNQCNADPEMKKDLLAPIAMIIPRDVQDYYMQGDCLGIEHRVRLQMESIQMTIDAKRGALVNAQASGEALPEGLTAAELAYVEYQANNQPKVLEMIAARINQTLACYTDQAKAALICEIAAGLATAAAGGMAISVMTRSPKIAALLNDLRQEAAVVRSENFSDEMLGIQKIPNCPVTRSRFIASASGSLGTRSGPIACVPSLQQVLDSPGLTKPDVWDDKIYETFRKEAAIAKNDVTARPTSKIDGEKMSLQSIQEAICGKSNTRCAPSKPEVKYDPKGKVLLKFKRPNGFPQNFEVRLNMSQGEHYFTVKEPYSGVYYRFNNGVFEATNDLDAAHMGIEGL